MIGGISYFHTYAYDLLATNERIIAASCDAAIEAHRAPVAAKGHLPLLLHGLRIDDLWPSDEGQEREIPPPLSSYGFQKLAVEYFARAAHDQYGLPYTIVRPVQLRRHRRTARPRRRGDPVGQRQLAMSHVVPDLVQKVVKGQDPLHILGDGSQVRHYTYGGDLAVGIVTAMEHPRRSTTTSTSRRQSRPLSSSSPRLIWHKINGDEPFRYVCDTPFEHDVARRVPSTAKAERVLGFQATTGLSAMLDEVIPWITQGGCGRNDLATIGSHSLKRQSRKFRSLSTSSGLPDASQDS